MLPWPYRVYFWGVHGVFAEVVFTAIWEFVVSGSLTLMGVSSIWSFLTYGCGTFLGVELLRGVLRARGIPTWLRCLLYIPMAYVWELGCGMALSYFDVCPWDYSLFDYNFMGLITLEYAPLWLLGGAYFEFLISCMASVEEKPTWRQKLE